MDAKVIEFTRPSPLLSDARAIVRMDERERRLEAELAQLRQDRRIVAGRFCKSIGIMVILRGPQLLREAMTVIESRARK